jgi:hypothetical protein
VTDCGPAFSVDFADLATGAVDIFPAIALRAPLDCARVKRESEIVMTVIGNSFQRYFIGSYLLVEDLCEFHHGNDYFVDNLQR